MLTFEDLRTEKKYHLWKLFGVNWVATRYAFLCIPFYLTLGLVVEGLTGDKNLLLTRFMYGSVYGMLIFLLVTLHTIGHIISGKIVGAPMSDNILTSTFQVNKYDDQKRFHRSIHVGRALGGPILNLSLGILAWLFHHIYPNPWVKFLSISSIVVGLYTLLPLSSLDGEVLWSGGKNHRN